MLESRWSILQNVSYYFYHQGPFGVNFSLPEAMAVWHKKLLSALLSHNVVLAIVWCLMCLMRQLLEIGAPDGAIFLNFTIYHWALPISATHFCQTSYIERGGTMYLYYTLSISVSEWNQALLFYLNLWRLILQRSIGPWWEGLINTFKLYIEFQVLGLKSHMLKGGY